MFLALTGRYTNTIIFSLTLVVLIVISIVALAFSQTRQESLRNQALNVLNISARDVANELEEKLIRAQQLAFTTASVLSTTDRDRVSVPRQLERMIGSVSHEDVFGVGVWYEPNRFEANTRHFGPYINRISPLEQPYTFTNYWNQPSDENGGYDYLEQEWYKTAKEGAGEVRFTEPYLDGELVFLTTGLAFYDDSAMLGVVTVDLVLPQLQDYIARVNRLAPELVYLTTAENAVLAHPTPSELITTAQTDDGSLLGVTGEQALAFANEKVGGNCVHVVERVRFTNWGVNICANQASVFSEAITLSVGLQTGLVILWSSTLVGSFAITQAINRANEEHKQRKTLQEEVKRQQAVQEVLESKVQERTQELAKAREEAESANRLKSVFLASMSHELRTPLNAILNYTDFLSIGMMGEVTPTQVETLEKVSDSGRHLLSLINDVLDLSKIETGGMRLFVEDDVNLSTEVNTALNTAQALLKDKPTVQLIQNMPLPSQLPLMVGDRRRIRQILLNLLSNAIKFTENGSITLAVSVNAEEVNISVKDTGTGIPSTDLELIFEPFEQSAEGIRRGSGTGLGLPISKRFAEAHGGKLWAESTMEQGSTFYVVLPIRSEMLLAFVYSKDANTQN